MCAWTLRKTSKACAQPRPPRGHGDARIARETLGTRSSRLSQGRGAAETGGGFGEGCGLQLPGRQRQPASPVAVSILELHLSPRRQGGGKAPNIINACDTPCPPPTPPAALPPLPAAPQASLVSGSSCVPSTAGYKSVLSDRPVLDACGAANSIISRFLLNFRTPETRVKTGPLVAAARTPHPRHRSAHGSPKWIHAHPNFPVRVESPHKK